MITLKSPREIEKLQESADLVSSVMNTMLAAAEPGDYPELDRLGENNTMLVRFPCLRVSWLSLHRLCIYQ